MPGTALLCAFQFFCTCVHVACAGRPCCVCPASTDTPYPCAPCLSEFLYRTCALQAHAYVSCVLVCLCVCVCRLETTSLAVLETALKEGQELASAQNVQTMHALREPVSMDVKVTHAGGCLAGVSM